MVGNLSLLLLGNLNRLTYWERIVFARLNARNDGYVMTLKEERNGRAIRIRKGEKKRRRYPKPCHFD